jgi:hypothetical protein
MRTPTSSLMATSDRAGRGGCTPRGRTASSADTSTSSRSAPSSSATYAACGSGTMVPYTMAPHARRNGCANPFVRVSDHSRVYPNHSQGRWLTLTCLSVQSLEELAPVRARQSLVSYVLRPIETIDKFKPYHSTPWAGLWGGSGNADV